MKQAKGLTRDQKEIVKSHGLVPNNWMLQQETEFYFHLVNKTSGASKIIDKFKRGKKNA